MPSSPYPDLFDAATVEAQRRRIAALAPDTAPQWGRMSAPAMIAHLNVAYERRVLAAGRAAFEGRESPSFGPLTADEWNVLFGKHLDHHLRQFGV